MRLNHFSSIDTDTILAAKAEFGSPLYLYDEATLVQKCRDVLAMPNAYGLRVRYAMKANPNRSLLGIIAREGLLIDASSVGEVRRARLAGIGCDKIILTTQEVPEGDDRRDLERMMLEGLLYNVCSRRQLELVGDFAAAHRLPLAIRVHPGIGSGESASRNTGDHYSCFGIHLMDLGEALGYAQARGLRFSHVHTHIGSGGDPEMWRANIDLELGIIERHFPYAETVSFGGGLKEARMPDETAADLHTLGQYAKRRLLEFYARTGRRLVTEVEPGTYITANCGYAVTTVMDKKVTGAQGFHFILTDGGMELNSRPLLYGSRHPFYVISAGGRLLSSEFGGGDPGAARYMAVVAGKCCESGDCQSLDTDGVSYPREMAEPEPGDTLVIGGTGAYCSAMAPFNYNSHTQVPEALYTADGHLRLIRRRQTLAQMVENEL